MGPHVQSPIKAFGNGLGTEAVSTATFGWRGRCAMRSPGLLVLCLIHELSTNCMAGVA